MKMKIVPDVIGKQNLILVRPDMTVREAAKLMATHKIGAVMVGHDGHRGWIYYLAADPRRRRQGIGKKLVDAVELWLEARGIPKLQLMIRESNTPVVSFYERLGFEIAPRIIMQKWL